MDNISIRNMRHRLGIPSPYHLSNTEQIEQDIIKTPQLDYLTDGMSVILRSNGGYLQQERMIMDKKRSFDRARLFSYQGQNIQKENKKKPIRALINPNKVKQDYDEKILSAPKEAEFKTGDVFEWLGTDTRWICYLQELTELAYFRCNIRKCQYEIAWEDDGIHKTYAAIRGPVETKINFIQKHQIQVDNPNYSLNILMPKTEAALKYFRRYSKFYLQDNNPGAEKICWRVEAVDWISMPGILEINAVEYYANETEDDIENGVVGGLIVDKISPNEKPTDIIIKGETFIMPKTTYTYEYTGEDILTWKIDKKYPVEVIFSDNNKITLKWTSPYSGQFEIKKGDCIKTVVVQSLF